MKIIKRLISSVVLINFEFTTAQIVLEPNSQIVEQPPTSGRFFYSDMRSESLHHIKGVHFMDLMVGNPP